MAALEYLGILLAVVLMAGALLVVSERRLGHRAPVRPLPTLVAPLRDPRPPTPRPPRPPRPRREPPPPRGPTVELPSWW
jgi:hypothetical protein